MRSPDRTDGDCLAPWAWMLGMNPSMEGEAWPCSPFYKVGLGVGSGLSGVGT